MGKYGILHFLRLVLKARSIFIPLIDVHGGRVIKYEGDNIIAVFTDAAHALQCITDARLLLDSYNAAREKDFQIRMGISVDSGEVLVVGNDLLGTAFDHSFHLAEEVSEVGEVLIASSLYEALLDNAAIKSISNVRQVDHPDTN